MRGEYLDEVEAHKRNCFARWMLKNWTKAKIRSWLAELDNDRLKDDMRRRLNEQKTKRA